MLAPVQAVVHPEMLAPMETLELLEIPAPLEMPATLVEQEMLAPQAQQVMLARLVLPATSAPRRHSDLHSQRFQVEQRAMAVQVATPAQEVRAELRVTQALEVLQVMVDPVERVVQAAPREILAAPEIPGATAQQEMVALQAMAHRAMQEIQVQPVVVVAADQAAAVALQAPRAV